MKILDPNVSYTFSKIFELKIPADELADEFGYSLAKKKLNLPQYAEELERLDELRSRIEEVLPYVDLSNEASRREILISRIVTEVVHYTKVQLRIEYPITVSQQLHRSQKHIDQGLESYRVPEDIAPLMRILIQALTSKSENWFLPVV